MNTDQNGNPCTPERAAYCREREQIAHERAQAMKKPAPQKDAMQIKYYPPIPKSTILRHVAPVYAALTTHVDTTSESMDEHGEIFVTRYEESLIGGVHIVEVYEDNALLPHFRAWLE